MLSIKTGQDVALPQGFLLGHVSDEVAATGCTVVLCPQGAVGSVAVCGAAPATRETDLLTPENAVQMVHGVVLSGGSAYGLDAASGVMRFLEEQGAGFTMGEVVVPIVVAASLFDLDIASATRRPDAEMGYRAAIVASSNPEATGNIGAGTGACVGRFLGPDSAMKGGLGIASVESSDLLVSAVVAVNSFGNVFDRRTGTYIAGARLTEDDRTFIVEPMDILPELLSVMSVQRTNTTIGAVITNANLNKAEALRAATMAHDGLARAIYPVHTSFDGDALFTLAKGSVAAHPDAVGTLAALAVEQAILDAVLSAEEAYGLPSARSLRNQQ